MSVVARLDIIWSQLTVTEAIHTTKGESISFRLNGSPILEIDHAIEVEQKMLPKLTTEEYVRY